MPARPCLLQALIRHLLEIDEDRGHAIKCFAPALLTEVEVLRKEVKFFGGRFESLPEDSHSCSGVIVFEGHGGQEPFGPVGKEWILDDVCLVIANGSDQDQSVDRANLSKLKFAKHLLPIGPCLLNMVVATRTYVGMKEFAGAPGWGQTPFFEVFGLDPAVEHECTWRGECS